MRLNNDSATSLTLDAAGLVALAGLSTISQRTALIGSASIFDILFLVPGIHTQQDASNVNGGELPAAGAMTSGYVFRIENQATVNYLQKVGKPGCLVTIKVEKREAHSSLLARIPLPTSFDANNLTASFLYMIGIVLTVVVITILGTVRDYWAITVLLMLVFARFLNTIVIKRRAQVGWKGVPEPGVKGDLLVLLSQDRWIRMQGLVDDLKAVASGQWLRDQTIIEGYATAFATLLVYFAAALASNASTAGSLLLVALLVVSVALLGLCNALTRDLSMFGRRLYVSSGPKQYTRRLDMAKELIKESGRDDWAISMGLILPPTAAQSTQVTM
ncbi:hypothetical protein K474DRAFT_797090 [Panus rudis PR-1116 ss-1]|nr:hypothetical protein K474DRAFT_797090 [Panus rudis PR-1116 ss-1]